ncbi:endonuclease/exonuclease/phosphatase family protein [Paenibacillus sp. GYB003]|uniref:endonuclease/exonuclease/phosphatase family protein n=1 Tax=Paenibacillus sp. GYB003 TaxID=2994392 RepID=UPI002F96D476
MKAKAAIVCTMMLGICAATAAGGCSKERPANANAAALKVMSFNLRTAAAKDDHPWAKRLSVAKALIQSEKPDLLGTQEGIRSQLTDLESALPGYKWIGEGRDRGGQGEYMAIFYNEARLKPLRQRHFWLSDTPDVPGSKSWGNSYPRMATWVLFEDRTTGHRFYAVNTHLDHQSEAARQLGAGLIARSIGEFGEDAPVLLTGDFNAAVGSGPYRILTAEGKLKDAVRDAAAKVNENVGTFHGYKGGGSGQTIDWILYRGDVRVARSEVVTFSEGGQFPSDHYPVTAEIAFQGTPKKQ